MSRVSYRRWDTPHLHQGEEKILTMQFSVLGSGCYTLSMSIADTLLYLSWSLQEYIIATPKKHMVIEST